jgi:hypothetical protein
MKGWPKTRTLFVISVLLIGIASGLQAQSVPLRNWAAPAVWTPPSAPGTKGLMDLSFSLSFTAINPCRIADTRGGSFTGQAGTPALSSFTNRVFQVAGTVAGIPTQCLIPSGAQAVSFQFTIVFPSSSGNLIAWSSGPVPNVSVLNWDTGVVALGNGTVVPLATDAITVRLNTAASGQNAQLVIDVNGYYAPMANTPNAFVYEVFNQGTFGAAHIENTATTGSNVHGITAITHSTGDGSAGIYALNLGAGGFTFGVKGQASATTTDSAGVKGITGYGDQFGDSTDCGPCFAAGVRGVTGNTLNTSYGVLGISRTRGTAGVVIDGTGATLATGVLGYFNGSSGIAGFFFGDTGATGVKSFVDPHPTDSSKVIRYVSLEGPEAGTYFRGTARIVGGQARIEVPEDFRMVTDEDGLTVQLTPVGAAASMYIVSEDLNEIVVASNRNVSFHYQVNGVRRSFKDFQPVQEAGTTFMPDRADGRIPDYLSEQQKKSLISNGTYNADGTPNQDTAKARGWDKAWAAAQAGKESE